MTRHGARTDREGRAVDQEDLYEAAARRADALVEEDRFADIELAAMTRKRVGIARGGNANLLRRGRTQARGKPEDQRQEGRAETAPSPVTTRRTAHGQNLFCKPTIAVRSSNALMS